MILYSKAWQGFPLIFRYQGTAWPSGILPACIAVAVGYVISVVPDVDAVMSDKNQFMQHPYPFQLYAFIIGFIIVFRTNFAYQRYWEGRGTIAQMGSKWLDGACMSVSFDATGDVNTPYLDGIDTHPRAGRRTSVEAPSHERFFEEIVHLFSLMHALALMHLRSDTNLDHLKLLSVEEANGQHPHNNAPESMEPVTPKRIRESRRLTALKQKPLHSHQISEIREAHRKNMLRIGISKRSQANLDEVYRWQCLDVIGGVTDEERAALEKDSLDNPIPTEARVTMVESWIMRRLIARQKHEGADMALTSPPILSRLYQVISDGFIGFGQASKISDTPFPFPYQNMIQICLWIYVFTLPVLMNAFLRDHIIRGVLTFMAVWCYFALNQVGSNLEDPYLPHDPNELPLTHIQYAFNAKLLSLGVVPGMPDIPGVGPLSPAACADGFQVETNVDVEECVVETGTRSISSSALPGDIFGELPAKDAVFLDLVPKGRPGSSGSSAPAPAKKLQESPASAVLAETKAQLSVAFEPPLAKCMDMPARRVSAGSKSTDASSSSWPRGDDGPRDRGKPAPLPVVPRDPGGFDALLERKEEVLRQTLEEMRSGHARLADLVEALVLQRHDFAERACEKLRLPLLAHADDLLAGRIDNGSSGSQDMREGVVDVVSLRRSQV